MTPRYTATKSLTPDGTSWIMSFRHPVRRDARAKQGRKIRRGLNTGNEEQAERLIGQMNEILADPSWHNPARRAEAERRFDAIVVRAFFDDFNTRTPDSSWEVRNELLPLPSREEGFAHVFAVGATGSGKTSLERALIGSHPERDRFPSTSASRTTISDIELVMVEEPEYSAVTTFFSESHIHTNVFECVADACSALWQDVSDEKLAARLLTHHDLRFRLGYVIGAWQATDSQEAADDWDYEDEEPEDSAFDVVDEAALPTRAERQAMQAFLRNCLTRIRALAHQSKQELLKTLELVELSDLSDSQRDAAQDQFEHLVQSLPDFDELVNDIMDQIRTRFERIGPGELRRPGNSWPLCWSFTSESREEFIRAVRRFSSNYAAAFGTLLTPLVDGVRIRGPLFPDAFTDRRPRLVLLDGEGLGHVEDPAAGLPARIARRFAQVDVILLVDTAKSPMLEAPASVLRAVAASGHQSKLALAFTHFDLLKGQANLPDYPAQRAYVLSIVQQKLASLRSIVGPPAVRIIERELEARSFMLGFLDRPLTRKQRGPVGELLRLIDFCERAVAPSAPAPVRPGYDTAALFRMIQAATTEFHARWNALLFTGASGVRRAHWREIKALNRRVVLDMDNSEFRDLRPVADLVGRLSEWITKFLDKPSQWSPRAPSEPEAESAIAQVQRSLFLRLYVFVDSKLLRQPRRDWVRAFEYSGRGSTSDRARLINLIYQTSTPIPPPGDDPHSEEFLRELRVLVHQAIHEGGGEVISAKLSARADLADDSN